MKILDKRKISCYNNNRKGVEPPAMPLSGGKAFISGATQQQGGCQNGENQQSKQTLKAEKEHDKKAERATF